MANRKINAAIAHAIEELKGKTVELSLKIHGDPELAFHEHHAAASLVEWLEAEGFAVETGVAGLETAFVASRGSGSPCIAYILEYDALPVLGHACGHNLIASGGLTAATSVSRAFGAELPGTLMVIGAPAEEDGGGKIIELDAGIFAGVDAALMFHPSDRTLPWRNSLACSTLRIKFHGLAAHAAKEPQAGRNALTAMIQFFVAVDGLRQHIDPQARMHGIITKGGSAPNVVPELTEAEFLVRHPRVAGALELEKRVRQCAAGAALMTGTEVEITEPTPLYANRLDNKTMAQAVVTHLESFGVVVDIPQPDDRAGSSDIGNVSHMLPTIHPYLRIAPLGVPEHSHAFTNITCSPFAHEQTLLMAHALALVGADLLTDPEFLDRARKEFEAQQHPAQHDISDVN